MEEYTMAIPEFVLNVDSDQLILRVDIRLVTCNPKGRYRLSSCCCPIAEAEDC